MSRFFYLITCSLLLATGWANALAQGTPAVSPAQRLKLDLVDNRSNFVINEQQGTYENHYVNTLSLSQPTDNKLTAGMLNEGNNYIVFTRTDDANNATEFARINLNAVKTIPESEVIDIIDFYNDGANPPSSQTTITQSMLPDNWGTNGSNLIWQTSGYAYINNVGGLTYTVPAGYSDATMQFIIYNGSNARGGYWATNLNDEGWSIAARATAGGSSSIVISGMNSGDVVSFLGASYSNSQYSLYSSPDIELIGVIDLPTSYVPTFEVTPTISYWDRNNQNWGTSSSLGSNITYSPNDDINLSSLGTVTDQFSVSTESSYPESYSYNVTYNANVVIPSSGTGSDFYASADFTTCTTSNPGSGTLTGHNSWSFNSSGAYMDDNNGIWAYIQYYGAIIYTMPESFLGNSVTVTVTSGPNLDNSDNNYTGILVVNDVQYTFNGSGTHSWTVPVSAGGIIEFKTDGQTYSTDIASIVISSGNGSALNAPVQASNGKFISLPRGMNAKAALPIERSSKQREIKVIIND